MTTSLFALDIGTRSVVGIILNEDNGNYHVEDLITIEHKERSMIDGQIHNVLSVANVITEIKNMLEKKHGPLKRVSVAAAGRALKTVEGSMLIDISEGSLISIEDINRLELAAVQKAQQQLLSSNPSGKEDHYYCVGYSVLHHWLDGEVIGSLIDQTGRSASVKVIATFLPQVVVESLLAALKRAELEMEALTLEPIAAINVLIPPSMRKLNVALVDIGAGTSDIAITADSTVIAYGMVPIAGDEITEALSNHYLLDFPLAEIAKRTLSNSEEVVITDILGFEQIIPSAEIINIIKPSIERLGKSISDEIIKLNNGKPPQAVMMVGGGSLTPLITKEISRYLELPETRVGIRGLEALTGVTIAEDIGSSPDLVTPIGIAIAARRAPIHYMSVMVNNKSIRLFELKEMTVGDALLSANIKARQLYGKPGLGMTITINNNDIIIPGEHGTPSTILLNGTSASTKDLVSNEDVIELVLGENGKDASAIVSDLFDDLTALEVTIDNTIVSLQPIIHINGKPKHLETIVQDRDKITLFQPRTLSAALEIIKSSHLLNTNKFTVKVNDKSVLLKNRSVQFSIQGTTISHAHLLKDGDVVEIHRPHLPTIEEVALETGNRVVETITVTFNNINLTIKKNKLTFVLNGETVPGDTFVKNNDRLEFTTINEMPIVFGDVFLYTDYTLPENTNGNYKLLRNGLPIGFNDEIFGGDILEITFQKDIKNLTD
ncbi:cell division protein FtsA [Sporosarcina siberiensis]|uniref:Cell division protein FtsA n=1 Tax=Sporosarcina siberiensis TaxID=1365606 RepID=A0ABW4SE63_9BACL